MVGVFFGRLGVVLALVRGWRGGVWGCLGIVGLELGGGRFVEEEWEGEGEGRGCLGLGLRVW